MFFLALRHLVSRKRQSILTLLGVALGTGTFVTFAAIMTGFQYYIIDQLVNNDAHVRISSEEKLVSAETLTPEIFPDKKNVFWITLPNGQSNAAKISYPLTWYSRLEKDNRVFAFAPQLSASVIYSKSGVTRGGVLRGTLPDQQERVTNIENYMIQGEFGNIKSGGQKLLIGEGLRKKMGLRVGDSIMVSDGRFAPVPFKVAGVFKLGIIGIDDTTAFAHLRDVQAAVKRPSEISDIAIRLVNVDLAQDFALQYSGLSKDKVLSWDQSNAGILGVFSLQDFIRNFITIAIMVVASFGIYNILNIVVNQKRKDIGILRSMGFDGHDIVILFLVQGVILGVLGGVFGLLIGFLMSKYLGTMQIAGMTDKMMVNYSLDIYSYGFIMALVASSLSSYLPARSASKLRPIDIVRGGD